MPGTTNFLQWNPTEANQESDAEYSADTFRADGAVGGIFPAETGNKLFYQVAAFCAAYAKMMANKGYTVNDYPFSTLVSVLGNVITNADQRGELQVMTYSPSQACDASKYLGFQIPLNGNVTISLSGQNMGDEIAFIFIQDATGGRTVTWPSNFYGFVQPITTANSISVQIGKVSSDLSVHAESASLVNPYTPTVVLNTSVGGPYGPVAHYTLEGNDFAGKLHIFNAYANPYQYNVTLFTMTFGGTYSSPLVCTWTRINDNAQAAPYTVTYGSSESVVSGVPTISTTHPGEETWIYSCVQS